jgi:betaine-aldehyde dehydrogenase
VAEKIADDFIAALVDKAGKLTVGGYDNPDAEMGPLTTAPQFAKVKSVFAQAQADGLDCLTGGKAVEGRKGYFVEPTIYRNVPQDHAIWQEEIFGPVLALRSFATVEEAITLANDTSFGLAATVVGTDRKAAEAVARQIEAGHVWVNTLQLIFPNTAWGGFKRSGIGRELGPWGLSAYQGIKHITQAA